jgi:hypothetical protein
MLIVAPADPAAALDVPLTVKETAGVGSAGYPVTVVVPLALGAYHDMSTFRVVGPDGAGVPAQFEVLNRWWARDNSIRHVLVHFQPTVGRFTGRGTGTAVYRLVNGGLRVTPEQPVLVNDTAESITISTGTFSITVARSPFGIVTPRGNLDAAFMGRTGVQRSFERPDVSVEVEERGPMRAVIRAEAPALYTDPANHTHGWALRLYVYAGKPWLKVDYQLQNSAKTKQYAAPLYFRSLILNRPGDVAATVRYATELESTLTGTAIELVSAANAWMDGLYWLDDMRHVLFETMLWFDGRPLDATFQFPPVAMLPTAWYAETRATLDLGGIVPTVAPGVKTDRRRPSPVDAAHRGWDNFYVDLGRKRATATGGSWAYSASAWIATEDPADVFEAERLALGELNVRPQWIAQYVHDRDWPALRLSANPYAGTSWRRHDPRASGLAREKLDAPYLPGTARRSHPRDDQHGWFYHVEEAYYATGNPWIRDWYRFIGEFRRVFLERKDPFPDGTSRGIGHAMSHALQAYRVVGTPAIITGVRAAARGWLKAGLLPTGARNSNACCGAPLESVFMTGYLSRALISYIEEVGDDPDVISIVHGLVRWNVEHANFGYNVDPTSPTLTGVSDGTALTMADPQAWYVLRTGDLEARAHLDAFVTAGINGGSRPYGDFTRWTGGFVGRLTQCLSSPAPRACYGPRTSGAGS